MGLVESRKNASEALRIRELAVEMFESIIDLADREIGEGYYTHESLVRLLECSTYQSRCLSFVAYCGDELIGFRLTLAPGKWSHGRGKGLSPEQWPVPLESAAYFQSCFIHSRWMGRGIGRKLSEASIATMRESGIPLVVAHSWKESPHNSSMRYLERLGFVPVQEYPGYWSEIDYVCSLDGFPCQCTAIEVILNLERPESKRPHIS